MKFRLHKTSIYFKRFFPVTSFTKESFGALCRKIDNFPLKNDFPKIKGLYLGGDHFFKKILMDETDTLDIKEIEQIESITPIVDDHAHLPFVFEHNYFEIILSAEGKRFEELMESIAEINQYLNHLIDDTTEKKIEIHLKAGAGKQLLDGFFKRAVPNLSKGMYQYDLRINKKTDAGQTSLPIPFESLPESIKESPDIIQGPYIIKLIKNNDKMILKKVKQDEMGLSLYSDESDWFNKTLKTWKTAGLFAGQAALPDPDTYPSLPSF